MKKLIITIGLALGLCFGTQAGQQVYQSIIPGWNPIPALDSAGDSVALLLNSNIVSGIVNSTNFVGTTTNGLTNAWGSAGVAYVVQGESYGKSYGTNAIILAASNARFAAAANVLATTNMQYICPPAVTLYGTNNTFWLAHALGSTNSLGANVDPAYWNDVEVHYDSNGNAIPLTLTAAYGTDQNSASATNAVTFTFIPTYDGLTYITNATFTLGGTAAANLCNGTNIVTATNTISSASLSGIKKLRLLKTVCSTNALADSVWCYSLGAADGIVSSH